MRTLLVAILVALLLPAAAGAAEPFPGSVWSEHYFSAGDALDTQLHADVLRPAHLPESADTPVILTVSPYLNHSGATTGYNPSASGPSDRFYDFLELSGAIAKGYTYVMVDLPGFGGSGGCNDWGGPAERGAVKAAVEWAGSQPWSTGSVGMIGKSYDGWTGLMAIAERPKHLAAVVSMEPVYSGYRYLYMDGVRFVNSVTTPGSFTVIDAKPGSSQDDPMYNLNGSPKGCYPLNIGQQQDDDPRSDFWKARDLLPPTRGATTPLFLTQGFLETNTKPDGAFALFNGLAGPKRAWFGQFDHVRGWERSGGGGGFATGRDGFTAEVMRFLDHHLRGAPAPGDPPVVVQAADGRYRAEDNWPPADTAVRTSALRPGSYVDDGRNSGTGSRGGNGLWTISPPLPHAAHLTGEPVIELELSAAPRANLVVNVYDIAPDGTATMISRGAMLIRVAGTTKVRPEMYGQDWPLPAGHRIGVLISGANEEWWTHAPTNATIDVRSGRVGLPFLRRERAQFLDGEPTSRLGAFLEHAPFEVAAATIAAAQSPFDLPPALIAAPAAPPAPASAPRTAVPSLSARATRRGRAITVRGRACGQRRVSLVLLRGRRILTRASVRVRGCAFSARLRTRVRGRLTVRLTVPGAPRRVVRVRGR